ncbi:hypothetical protein [Streptomyces sp. NPDC047315]|uniref:hypothetical protein n=1 Tax=Streptomyces sp. NPDC047315 TaxID=3155142 RepID=UPI0033D1561F
MSFGQGGPQWGSGEGQNQNPWNGRDPYGQGQGGDPYGTGRPGDGAYGNASDTPDWAALADASAERARKRRLLMIGGGGLATVGIAAIVATAIVLSNDSGDTPTTSTGSPSASVAQETQPGPSFASVAPAPPPNPSDYISDEKKDKAPLNLDTFFPGTTMTMADRRYAKGATNSTDACASAAQGALPAVLSSNGCDRVFRATYSKDGVAVTIGVAVFGTQAEAQRAAETKRNIAPLPGAGVPSFCKGGPVCLFRSSYAGRYAFYTSTGFTNGKSVTAQDAKVYQAAKDITDLTFQQVRARGEAQASAAAATGG